MTAPLTPPECDLQDFPFMPLHVARLRDSDLAAEMSPEACWYAVLLWAASWHQIPAASLPESDAVLARLLGLGRDLRTFRKHKAAAMRGFVLCEDGRLYHPVVAELALNAWQGKLQQRWRTECARVKKANQRNGTDHPAPSFDEFMSQGARGNCPEDVPGDEAESPSGQSVQEKGRGTEKGRSRTPKSPKGTSVELEDWKGPPDVLRAIASAKGEVWALTYLRHCRHRDLPSRALVTSSSAIASKLRQEVEGELRALGVAVVIEAAA